VERAARKLYNEPRARIAITGMGGTNGRVGRSRIDGKGEKNRDPANYPFAATRRKKLIKNGDKGREG